MATLLSSQLFTPISYDEKSYRDKIVFFLAGTVAGIWLIWSQQQLLLTLVAINGLTFGLRDVFEESRHLLPVLELRWHLRYGLTLVASGLYSFLCGIVSAYRCLILALLQAKANSWLTVAVAASLAFFVITIIRDVRKTLHLRAYAHRNACLPVRVMPNPFPWKLRRYWELSKVNHNLLDDYLLRKYQNNGMTHGLVTGVTKRLKSISTIDPENFQAVLSTKFNDFERPKFRAEAAKPFMGPGIFTSVRLMTEEAYGCADIGKQDGAEWAYSRKLIKSLFTRQRFEANIPVAERHLQVAFQAIGSVLSDGWTNHIDVMVCLLASCRGRIIDRLQEYFFRFSMDSSTEFLFGISANTQVYALARKGKIPEPDCLVSMDGFEHAFKRVQKYVGIRMRLGKNYWLCDGPKYRAACRELIDIMTPFILTAVSLAQDRLKAGNQPANLIEAMVAAGHDFPWIANQCRHLIIAGFETTSSLLGFTFALLEANQESFNKLRNIIVEEFGTELHPRTPMTFETLKNCSFLQHIMSETLRLYPAGPSNARVAVCDTVLPVGGGPDGKGPIAVPKGATVQLGVYLCHRRKDIWGDDAAEFRPERWEGRKKGFEFIPFNAGPQICIGRKTHILTPG